MAREPDSGATEVPQQRMNAVNDPAAFARIATVFGTARGHATRSMSLSVAITIDMDHSWSAQRVATQSAHQ
ncbi:hypothetical protein BLA6993_00254 [Burkholderia lata]|nr:hypothetical protein BLA6993_00254 [Burkholderia lata]